MDKFIIHQANASNIYDRGIELYIKENNYSEALIYLKRAATEGYKKAFCEVGIILCREKNETDEAEKWFQKAEKLKALSPEAIYEYGMLHYLHKKDWETGLKYLLQSAEQEYEPAYGDIGCILYLYKSEIDTALEWFAKADEADCLYPPAAFYYGLLLKIERKDSAKSIKYFRQAADGKFELAYGELGSALYFQDEIDEAEMWFKKAEKADCLIAPNVHSYGMLLIEERGEIERGNYYLDKAAEEGFE